MERIFVQIASYRDPECQWTLKDMFAKAMHPERIFAGVCWIYDAKEDQECLAEEAPYAAQVRTVFYTPDEERGINWARMQAQALWQGEEFVLQIHAHSRFAEGWDNILISQLLKCPSKKAVLSTCLPAYAPPDTFPYRDETRASFTTVFKFEPGDSQILGVAGKLVAKTTAIPALMRSAFAVSNFLFARSELMQAVPYDPHLYYFNSELAYSARLWTHGYDIFQPDTYAVFHWYGRVNTRPKPYAEFHNPKHAASLKRLRHLLRLEASPTSDALENLDAYTLGAVRSIEDFWEFAGVNPSKSGIADHARKGEWDTAYQSYLEKKAKPQPALPTIFIQIASYRDTECQWTIKDLFDKAAHPDRIRVGICWQYDPDEDKDCFLYSTRPEQVRISPFHWKESQGVCWARHQAQLLYENEDYVLMIDSHIRFVFGWDEWLVQELAKCKSPKPVLSNHPAIYHVPHELQVNPFPSALCVLPFTQNGDIRVSGGYVRSKPTAPLHGAFVAAGFIFARGSIIQEVPYDPYLYFNQEEVSLSARLYTHGWDVFHLSKVVAYHLYNVEDGKQPNRKRRPLHWSDNTDWGKLQDRAKKRFDHLLGHTTYDDPDVLRDLMRYGLGEARTLEAFEQFTGIDFKQRTTSDVATNYGFTEELRRYMRPDVPGPAKGGAEIWAFPNPARTVDLPYNIMLMADGSERVLNVESNAPEGVLIIYDYVERGICDALARYADAQTFTDLGVVDFDKTGKTGQVVVQKNEGRVTNHVDIDGVAADVLTIFNDLYCNRLAPFYNVNFEWYERPQILRYPAGGKYNQHADADHWVADKNEWVRVQDRDYSVLLYLNDEYEGGEIQFVNQNFTIKPKPGMMLAFPSDYRYLHAALPTTSGVRYVIVSWAAILGSKRVRPQIPYASVFVRQKRKLVV